MKKRWGKIVFRTREYAVCILCLITLLTAVCPVTAFAAEPEQKTVRVGYVNVATYEEGGEGEYKRGSG